MGYKLGNESKSKNTTFIYHKLGYNKLKYLYDNLIYLFVQIFGCAQPNIKIPKFI